MGARAAAVTPLGLAAMTGVIFHLIPHTHWDREWYLPRAAFQARLIPALDDLIERLQTDAGYRSFLLDGQTVLVADYLTARPERKADIQTLVKTGRLQVGPWYVLADELIPSGEALVRNLLLGAGDADQPGGGHAAGRGGPARRSVGRDPARPGGARDREAHPGVHRRRPSRRAPRCVAPARPAGRARAAQRVPGVAPR